MSTARRWREVEKAQSFRQTGFGQKYSMNLPNTLDPADPFRHELMYLGLATLAGRLNNLIILPVPRYGHCNFTTQELLGVLTLMVHRSTGRTIPNLEAYLSTLPKPYSGSTP